MKDPQESNELESPEEILDRMISEGMSPIQAWRARLKISRSELAAKLRLRLNDVSLIEDPGAKPDKKTLKRVATALGIPVMELETAYRAQRWHAE